MAYIKKYYMKSHLLLILFISLATPSYCQDFSFQIYFEDTFGNKDTLTLGYDINGTDTIDTALGELNIISSPIDTSLDVRISNEWYNREFLSTVGTFHTKRQIVEENCGNWFSISTIDIYTDNWPVTASWDSTLFNYLCINGSVFTSVNPGGWWDTAGPSDLLITLFKNSNSVTFTSNVAGEINDYGYIDYGYINNDNDTIPVFWQAFGDSTLTHMGVNETFTAIDFKIFPNPTSDYLNIELKGNDAIIKNVKIFDIMGTEQQIIWTKQLINLSHLSTGIFFVQIRLQNNQIITRTIIKE